MLGSSKLSGLAADTETIGRRPGPDGAACAADSQSVKGSAMTGSVQGAERGGRGWRFVAVTVLAAAVVGPVSGALASSPAPPAGALAAAGPPAAPLAGRSAAPRGWAPVPFGRAQLSVPGQWPVETPRQFWCPMPSSRGMIFAGTMPRIPKGAGCALTASLAWIVPAGHIPTGIRHRKPTALIHGIPVYRLPSGDGSVRYLVPELGVRVGASGPLARRVLGTLARSPLSVVLKSGPAGPVPSDWTWHLFGGVRFATPRTWNTQREHQWATCGTGITPRSLLLIDATRPPAILPCPYPFPTAAAEQAQPGLTVVTGRFAARSVGEHFTRCQVRHGARFCLSAVTGQGGFTSGVLIFSVSRPHHGATFFLLGLSGSGAHARTIYGSLRPARH
jgi:hypothetical protein